MPKLVDTIQVSPRLLTKAIKCYSNYGLREEAFFLYNSIFRGNPSIVNDQHITVVLQMYRDTNRILEGIQVYKNYTSYKSNKINSKQSHDAILTASILSLYSAANTNLYFKHPTLLSDILKIKEYLDNSNFQMTPNIYVPLLIICGKIQRFDLVLQLYNESCNIYKMNNDENTDIESHMTILSAFISAANECKQYEEAFIKYENIRKYNIYPNSAFICHLIDICFKTKKTNYGMEIFLDWYQSSNNHDHPNINIDLYLCRTMLYLISFPHEVMDIDRYQLTLSILRNTLMSSMSPLYPLHPKAINTLLLLSYHITTFGELDELITLIENIDNTFLDQQRIRYNSYMNRYDHNYSDNEPNNIDNNNNGNNNNDEESKENRQKQYRLWYTLMNALARQNKWQLMLSLLQRIDLMDNIISPEEKADILSLCIAVLFRTNQDDRAILLLSNKINCFKPNEKSDIHISKLLKILKQFEISNYYSKILILLDDLQLLNSFVLSDFLEESVHPNEILEILSTKRSSNNNGTDRRIVTASMLQRYQIHLLMNKCLDNYKNMEKNGSSLIKPDISSNKEVLKSIYEELNKIGVPNVHYNALQEHINTITK